MIAIYSKRNADTFVYKKLTDSLSGISSTRTSDNVDVSVLKNANVISDNYEIVLENRHEYDNCVSLGEIADISQGVVEASDCVSKRLYDKFPRDDVYVGKGIFVLSLAEVQSLELNDAEKHVWFLMRMEIIFQGIILSLLRDI